MNPDSQKVVLLYDAQAEEAKSPDQRDALIQVEAVGTALKELGWEPVRLPFTPDFNTFRRDLSALAPAFVFNLVESVDGEGRLIYLGSAFLDVLGVPYTGAGTESLYITSNKLLAKRLLTREGICTPKAFSLKEALETRQSLGGEYIIKSLWEHASVGLGEDSIVQANTTGDLAEEMKARRRAMGGEWFAEAFVEGREFNISLLAGGGVAEVLPHAEIRFEGFPPSKRKVVDYKAKWDEESFEFRNTPRCFDFPEEDRPLLVSLSNLSARCWEIFDLQGYARVDFRVDRSGCAWILEVNANPCLSPDAGFAAAASRAEIGFTHVVARIIEDMKRRASWAD